MDDWQEKNTIRVNPENIAVPLPHYKSLTLTGCGAAAARSIGSYYGVGPTIEADWRKALKTNRGGTKSVNIANKLRELGLKVRPRKNTSLEELFQSLDEKHPVLCPIQAYGTYHEFRHMWTGHWVIAIGYNDKYVFFEDSFVKRRRTFLTYSNLETRWYDVDWDGVYYPRFSMTITGEPKRPVNLYLAQRIW